MSLDPIILRGTKIYRSKQPVSRNELLPITMRLHPSNAVRSGAGSYNSNNDTRFRSTYFYHSFGPDYTKCQIFWSVGFTGSSVEMELFAREYTPGNGNQSVSSATQNPILDSMLVIPGPHAPGQVYSEQASPIFDVSDGNLYELGCLRRSGSGNVRLYTANVIFLP